MHVHTCVCAYMRMCIHADVHTCGCATGLTLLSLSSLYLLFSVCEHCSSACFDQVLKFVLTILARRPSRPTGNWKFGLFKLFPLCLPSPLSRTECRRVKIGQVNISLYLRCSLLVNEPLLPPRGCLMFWCNSYP
jgi:hypothetical protein